MEIYVYGTKPVMFWPLFELLQILNYLKNYNDLGTIHFEYRKYQMDSLHITNSTYLFDLR